MAKIPPNFLPPQSPHNATSTVIDFASTIPPLPEYKNHFAAVIDNFMTADECKQLLAMAEKTAAAATTTTTTAAATINPWSRAKLNAGGGKEIMATDTRHCGRIIFDSSEIADRLLARLMPYLEQWDMARLQCGQRIGITGLAGRKNEYVLSRLNERLRFLKYVGGEYFRTHCDGKYRTDDGGEISFYTIHLYLNGEGEEGQDVKEVLKRKKAEDDKGLFVVEDGEKNGEGKLLGGATSFLESWTNTDEAVRVWPKTGRLLVFQQANLWHSGDSVYGGTKYTVRTDVMYRKVPI